MMVDVTAYRSIKFFLLKPLIVMWYGISCRQRIISDIVFREKSWYKNHCKSHVQIAARKFHSGGYDFRQMTRATQAATGWPDVDFINGDGWRFLMVFEARRAEPRPWIGVVTLSVLSDLSGLIIYLWPFLIEFDGFLEVLKQCYITWRLSKRHTLSPYFSISPFVWGFSFPIWTWCLQ